MKRIVLLNCLLFAFFVSLAQENNTWQVFYNNKEIFKGTENMEINAADFKKMRLKSSDVITLKYKTEKPAKGWKRTFLINNGNDETLKTLEVNELNSSVSVNGSVIKELINKKQPAFIYTISLPKDKNLAARVRVRRILLCKIDWN